MSYSTLFSWAPATMNEEVEKGMHQNYGKEATMNPSLA